MFISVKTENGALFVQKKSGFMVTVDMICRVTFRVNVSYRTSVSDTSFKNVIDLLCFEHR